MTEFDKSREKFEDALFNLERMVESIVEARLGENEKSSYLSKKNNIEDFDLLKKERDQLKKKLEESTENYDSLENVTSQLSDRLDKTIKKLKSILE